MQASASDSYSCGELYGISAILPYKEAIKSHGEVKLRILQLAVKSTVTAERGKLVRGAFRKIAGMSDKSKTQTHTDITRITAIHKNAACRRKAVPTLAVFRAVAKLRFSVCPRSA
jgi:hypothetical protein